MSVFSGKLQSHLWWWMICNDIWLSRILAWVADRSANIKYTVWLMEIWRCSWSKEKIVTPSSFANGLATNILYLTYMGTTSMTYLWKITHDFNFTPPGFLTLVRVVTNCDRCVTDCTYLVPHRGPTRRRWYWPLERLRHWKTLLCYRCPCLEIEPGQQGEVPGPSHTVYRGSYLRNTEVPIL